MTDEAAQHFGAGEVLYRSDEIWPRFPTLVLKDSVSERILVGDELIVGLLVTLSGLASRRF